MAIVMSFLSYALALTLMESSQPKIEVSFIESAPKDRFIVTNKSECKIESLALDIDLSKSAGNLIFDTTGAGAGVEVFQPFEIEQGEIELISTSGVKDGDTEISLRIQNLQPGSSASFTIDVDDTLPESELGRIRVAGSEMKGGLVRASTSNSELSTAIFGSQSTAMLSLPMCS